MPWLSHTFLLVHPKYHVEKLSITSHSAGKCAALETVYDKSLWKSCSLVVKALMCANNWLTTVSFLWRSKLCTLWCCVMSSKKANLSDVWQSVRAVKFPSSEKKGKEKKASVWIPDWVCDLFHLHIQLECQAGSVETGGGTGLWKNWN